MDRRPVEITEDDHDKGMDIQGLSWGIGDIPVKEDFREKRVKDYGSLIVKPPPQPAYINPVFPHSRSLANSRHTTHHEFIISINSATQISNTAAVSTTSNSVTSSPQPPRMISTTSTTTVSVGGTPWLERATWSITSNNPVKHPGKAGCPRPYPAETVSLP